MIQFIKNVFASALGFFLALGVLCLIGFIFMIGSIAASTSSQKPALKDGSVLHVDMNSVMVEQQNPNPINSLLGYGNPNLAMNEMLQAIRKAKNIKKIKGIYLDGGVLAADPASLEELRKALVDFKESGKFILSYADSYTQGSYYLSSVADKVMLNPNGTVMWKGLGSMPMFFKEALEKLGVSVQVFKVGTYKSAVEPFINSQMSEANREQVTSYLNSIWGNMVKAVSGSRQLSEDSLQHLADRFMGLRDSKEYVACNLVDTLVYIDGAKAMLKKMAGLDEDDKLNFLTPEEVCQLDDPKEKSSDNKVAIYYAAGDIVDEAPSGFSSGEMIIGKDVVKDMQELEEDDDVKAVVLRINSGGGSAYASEQMWHAIKKLDMKKPVVVSMGGLAASGGYYMSCAARYIIAEPMTLTGSIGIFGMIPDVSGLVKNKLGLTFDNVKTNAMSDFEANMGPYGTMSRPFNAQEGEIIQHYVESGYAQFLSRVAAGRKKTSEQIDSIGQGRVWTGEQALKIGLVDKLGTLNDAVVYAAKQAKLEKYQTEDFTDDEPWYMTLLNKGKDSYYETKLRSTLGPLYEPFKMVATMKKHDYVQARMPYNPNIY